MAPRRNLSPQQTLIQLQAATFIPIHLDSISLDQRRTTPRASIAMAQHRQVVSAYNATLPPSTQHEIESQGESGAENQPYNDWMTTFCAEPSNDVNTCCLGWWMPCVLYGKTHWRLKRISKGEDATDSDWKPKTGCNAPCWAWWGVSSLCCITLPISGK